MGANGSPGLLCTRVNQGEEAMTLCTITLGHWMSSVSKTKGHEQDLGTNQHH